MNDVNQAPQSQPTMTASPSKEVEEGRTFAILSYALGFIGLPFFLVPLIMRNNEFSLFHAKQCLLLWLAGIAISIVGVPLMAICIGFILMPAAGMCLVVLNVFGLINAVKSEQKPLPLIGKYAEDWFKGLKKA
jgi:uncharacterized membrane protein